MTPDSLDLACACGLFLVMVALTVLRIVGGA